jgi:hypothetical protein
MSLRSGKLPSLGSEDEFFDHKRTEPSALRTRVSRTRPPTENTGKVINRMPLLQVIVTVIVVGVLLWLVTRFIPMAGSIRSILNAVVVIAVVLWLLSIFALLSFLSGIRVGGKSLPLRGATTRANPALLNVARRFYQP